MTPGSSTTPLQSSSRPLQLSTVGGVTGHAYSQPLPGLPSLLAWPGAQAAITHCPATQPPMAALGEHTVPQPPQLSGSVCSSNPLSVMPSQSLSLPSQTSSVGPAPGTQISTEPAHSVVPALHSPWQTPPGHADEQGTPPPG